MEFILVLFFALVIWAAIIFAAIGILAALGSAALLFIRFVLPELLLTAAALTLRGVAAATIITIATLREMTGHAARGVAIWEDQPQWQQQAQERVRQEQSVPVIDSWEAACTLLGLPVEGFGKPELSRAYRRAIVTAHPDVGGNPALAKALNVARDLIRQQQGWA